MSTTTRCTRNQHDSYTMKAHKNRQAEFEQHTERGNRHLESETPHQEKHISVIRLNYMFLQ